MYHLLCLPLTSAKPCETNSFPNQSAYDIPSFFESFVVLESVMRPAVVVYQAVELLQVLSLAHFVSYPDNEHTRAPVVFVPRVRFALSVQKTISKLALETLLCRNAFSAFLWHIYISRELCDQ